jgi:hypothetical protein
MRTNPADQDSEPRSRSEPGLATDTTEQSKSRRRVSLSVVNFWLDASLLFLLCTLGWVSATLQIVFPAPTAADGWTLWGLSYDQCRDAQFVILCLLALDVVLHVMMHWNWVCSVIAMQILHTRKRPDEGMQTIYGVVTLIVLFHLIAAGVIAALVCVHQPAP